MRERMKKAGGGDEARDDAEVMGGTYRGTAYHKVMELMRYRDLYSYDGASAA